MTCQKNRGFAKRLNPHVYQFINNDRKTDQHSYYAISGNGHSAYLQGNENGYFC